MLEVEVEAEAEFKEAEQHIIFHSEGVCCKITAKSLMPSVL